MSDVKTKGAQSDGQNQPMVHSIFIGLAARQITGHMLLLCERYCTHRETKQEAVRLCVKRGTQAEKVSTSVTCHPLSA